MLAFMTTHHLILTLATITVYSYEEISRKKWFTTLFFGLAWIISSFVSHSAWAAVAPFLFAFSLSRFVFYSLPVTKQWPLNLGLTSAAFFIAIKLLNIPLPNEVWNLNMGFVALAFLVFAIVFSTVGLFVYFKFRDFDINLIPIPPIQKKHVTGMIVAGSIINSFREEIPYRWLFMMGLANLTDANTALIVQAGIFGAMHFHEGITNKWLGFLLTAVFGLGMGWITMQTGSISTAIVVHSVVDMILLMIVVKKFVPDSYFKPAPTTVG